MKLTPAQERHLFLTSRISRRAKTLSALSAEDMKNPTDEVLLMTDQFEDDLIEFLQLTGRMDVILGCHMENFVGEVHRVIAEHHVQLVVRRGGQHGLLGGVEHE